MKFQILFNRKNKKKYFKMLSVEFFLPSMRSINCNRELAWTLDSTFEIRSKKRGPVEIKKKDTKKTMTICWRWLIWMVLPSWSTIERYLQMKCVRLVIWRLRVRPPAGRQHSIVKIYHVIFSTVILSLPLLQEGQLSVSGERMCTILVNRLED